MGVCEGSQGSMRRTADTDRPEEPLPASGRARAHHSAEREAIDKTFAVHLPWIDRLFGTYHMPADRWPREYGIEGDPVPEGYVAQLIEPLRGKVRVDWRQGRSMLRACLDAA